MDPIISLILPAYNVADYIESCVHSCEEQDILSSDYEVIIVNDGSNDGITPYKIQDLTKTYPNIRVVNQKNQGLSMARNNGAKVAKGKYIWFIDSDDTIARNCLGSLLSIMDKHNLDALTVGPSIPFREEFPDIFNEATDLSAIYTGTDFLLNTQKFVVGAWCYIVRRSFWENAELQFYPGITYEDTQLMYYAISKTSRIAALTTFSCYNYILREGSIMNSGANKRKLMSHAVIVNTHLEYSKEVDHPRIKESFERSASCAFIGGISCLIKLGSNIELYRDFMNAIVQRPKKLYGVSIVDKIFQYFVLNYPLFYIRVRKWL